MGSHAAIITGASGFLGWTIARGFAEKGYVLTGTYSRTYPDAGAAQQWKRLSLTDQKDITTLLTLEPQCIVHCAAMARREDCDADPALAEQVNVDAARQIAAIARDWDMPIVYISTDLVFDGTRAPYHEEDPVSPASVYAETKARGEEAVRETCPKHYIVRPALMYGEHSGVPGSFLAWTAAALKQGENLNLFVNQFRTVLFAPDVPRLLHALIDGPAPFGTYHAAGPERLNRYDIGCRIADAMEAAHGQLRETYLERPEGLGEIDDTSLVTTKARTEANMNFTPLEAGLASLKPVLLGRS